MLPADPADVVAKGRLQPGKIFLVDVEQGRIVDDAEVKGEIARRRPYGRWFGERAVHLDDIAGRRSRRSCRPTRCAPASSCSATRRRTSA